MAAGTGIYITWITGAILLSIAMMPLFRPPYAKLRLDGFIDMDRRAQFTGLGHWPGGDSS